MIHHHTATACTYCLLYINHHIHSKCTPAHICLNDIPWRAPAWRWWRVASLSGYKNNTTRNSSSALAATQHQHPVPGLRGAASPGQHQHQHQQATLLLRNTGAEASHVPPPPSPCTRDSHGHGPHPCFPCLPSCFSIFYPSIILFSLSFFQA